LPSIADCESFSPALIMESDSGNAWINIGDTKRMGSPNFRRLIRSYVRCQQLWVDVGMLGQ
jgi:hypothetical protein